MSDNTERPDPQEEAMGTADDECDTLPPGACPWAPATKIAVGVGLVLFAFLVLWLSRGIFGTLALSALIAFLLALLIRVLHHCVGVPKGVALIATYILVLVFTVALRLMLIGSIVASLQDLDPGGAVEGLRTWILTTVDDANRVAVFGATLDVTEVLEPIEDWLRGEGGIPTADDQSPIRLSGEQFGTAIAGIIGGFTSVVAVLAAVSVGVGDGTDSGLSQHGQPPLPREPLSRRATWIRG